MPTGFKQRLLPNGLMVIAEANASAHSSAAGFFVRAGARDESPALMGVSHFLEHMMFKGTARRSAEDVNREFDAIGAEYNAFTSQEMTAYFAQVLPEYLPQAVDLFGDMLRPALREDDFEMEKKVILEEISMYDDRPADRLHDTLLETHYSRHPLGHRVLGYARTVAALTSGQMRDYFAHRYSPDNMVVALAGNIDFEAVVEQIASLTQDWQPTSVSRDYPDATFTPHTHALTDDRVNRHYIALMSAAPSSQSDLRYTARILADVLGDSEGSRLYWSLVDPGLADAADLSYSPQDRAGSFIAYASCDPDRAASVQEKLIHTLDHDARQITDEEIQRAKNKIATLATLNGESTVGRMHALGRQWLYHGQYTPLREELARIMAVSLGDVHRVLDEYPFTQRTQVQLGPAQATAAVPSA